MDAVITVPSPSAVRLSAGRITAELDGPDLRSVRVDGTEVLRRVYVAVRDRNWDTVAPVVLVQDVHEDTAGFRVELVVRHLRDDVGIEWRGRIVASDDGRLSFGVDGSATTSFLRRRIGMCVHHPVEGLAGRPCVVIHGDGRVEEGAFPRLVAPHQPFTDVRAIRHGVGAGVTVEVGFHGDVFETEDHRNWSDASFKTYSTPMGDGAPVQVSTGDRWHQEVTLRVDGQALRRSAPRRDATDPVTIHVLDGAGGRLPALGVALPADPGAVGHGQLELLRMARLSHVRVDLDMDDPAWDERLGHAWTIGREIGALLEVAVILGERADDQLAALADAVADVRPVIQRWIVHRAGRRATGHELVVRARAWLSSLDTTARFGTGSSDSFAPLNRQRPEASTLDFVSYGISPQIHASDDRSIIENLDGQPWTVITARSFTDADVVVSPIMLRPWSNPIASDPYPVEPGAPPDWADPRQGELIAASWTAMSIRNLAAAGASSCTYHQAAGWAGIMPTTAGAGWSGGAVAAPMVYPVFHALVDVGEVRSGSVGVVHSSRRTAVDGLAVRMADHTRLMLANLTAEPHEVVVTGLDGPVTGRSLDERTQELAMRDPVAARSERWTEVPRMDGRLQLKIGPHAVMCMDIST